jgi:hypothetical protein
MIKALFRVNSSGFGGDLALFLIHLATGLTLSLLPGVRVIRDFQNGNFTYSDPLHLGGKYLLDQKLFNS